VEDKENPLESPDVSFQDESGSFRNSKPEAIIINQTLDQ
jgi:hypothetical protein